MPPSHRHCEPRPRHAGRWAPSYARHSCKKAVRQRRGGRHTPDDLQRAGRGSIDLQGTVEGIAAMTEVRRGQVASLGKLVGRISSRLRLRVDTIIVGHGHRAGEEGYSRCALRPSKRCRGDHRSRERCRDECASHFLGLSPVASIEIEASKECTSRSGIDEAWGRAVGRARRRVESREGFLQQTLNSLYRLSLVLRGSSSRSTRSLRTIPAMCSASS